jgi:hypothetical protein
VNVTFPSSVGINGTVPGLRMAGQVQNRQASAMS